MDILPSLQGLNITAITALFVTTLVLAGAPNGYIAAYLETRIAGSPQQDADFKQLRVMSNRISGTIGAIQAVIVAFFIPDAITGEELNLLRLIPAVILGITASMSWHYGIYRSKLQKLLRMRRRNMGRK